MRRQEQIQERIAASLKSTGQLLANAAVELAACRLLLRNEPLTVEKGLISLENELRASLEELRWLLSDLQTPPLLQELGLAATLTRYAQRFSDHYGIRVSINSAISLPRLPVTVELAIFRIIQEGLRNVARHARTGHALLALRARFRTGRLGGCQRFDRYAGMGRTPAGASADHQRARPGHHVDPARPHRCVMIACLRMFRATAPTSRAVGCTQRTAANRSRRNANG